MSENMGRPRERPAGPEFDRAVGARIAAALETAGVTKTQLSAHIGKSLSAVSRYVSGDTPVDTQTLAKIAKVLKVKICTLLDGIKAP